GELDEGFFDPCDLEVSQREITVATVSLGCEAREAVGFNRDSPGRGKTKVAAVGQHSVKSAGEIPARTFVRRRIVEPVRFGGGMMRHITEISLDADGGVGDSDTDLEPAPNNGRRPVARHFLRGRNVLDDVEFERMRFL